MTHRWHCLGKYQLSLRVTPHMYIPRIQDLDKLVNAIDEIASRKPQQSGK